MKKGQREVLFGLYDDDQDLLDAVRQAKKEHLDIMDVFTPFPVHGLDPILGLEESRLHQAGFVYGSIGTMTAFFFMTWVFTRDYWSVPAFIPITFELTVLFAAIGMVVTFYTVCGMAPGVTNPVLHDRITDDKFCIAFQTNDYSDEQINRLKSFFSSTGASEVSTKII